MKFRDFAETLLGSKVKVKLISHLLKEESITSERELAKIIGVSHSAVNKALNDFHELNLITPLRVGNVIIWNMNKQSYAYNFLEHFSGKIKESPRDDLLSTIKSYFGFYKGIKKIVLFGSIAEGKETPNSDIDLLVLVENENIRKKVFRQTENLNSECLAIYGNKVSPQVLTEKEFALIEKRNKKFIESIKRGIVVFE